MRKIYEGRRSESGNVLVTVTTLPTRGMRPLPVRLGLRNHSPDGFEWGYAGSGPSQLALAILAEHLGVDNDAAAMDRCLRLYQDFKFKTVANFKSTYWRLTTAEIDSTLKGIELERQNRVHFVP